ncbi:unnamed protein product [Urochloa humidicola]
MGLFHSVRHTPSLTSFAIESLGSSSSEIQVVGLHVLDHFLARWDSESKKELIAEITYTHKKAVPSLISMLGSTVARHQHMRLLAATITNDLSGSLKIYDYPGMLKLVSSLLDANNKTQDSMPNYVSENDEGDDNERQLFQKIIFMRQILFYSLGLSILDKLACDPDNCTEIAKDATNVITKIVGLISYLTDEEDSGGSETHQKIMVYDSALKFVRRLAIKGRKMGARFRQDLSENPFLLNSLNRIMDLEDCQPELWELAMDIIAKMALDEDARQEIGCTQSIIQKLVHAFLRADDVNSSSNNNDNSLQMTAGEALVNLTIMSTENCWAILTVQAGHNLVANLASMLENECYICAAANLLHNLCANSRDKLIDLGANVHLESALSKTMQIIMSNEGKQLEAALCVASQIGYVIPEYFAHMLESEAVATAAELVKRLVDTLNREPCPDEYPRLRRVLVEVVIAIMDLCPRYTNIFREKGVKDALDMVKGTPSKFEKYRVFLDGEGLVAESITMRDLVDKAKRLIHGATPTPGAQPGDHA